MEKELLDAKKEYVAALSKVQSTIKPAKKDRENPFFKSHYATLVSVHEACSKALTDNGFAVTQGGVHEAGKNYLRTVLHHKGGYSEAYDFPLIEDLSNPQKMGSAVTYARRYSLAAIVGVIVDEDDDGAEASKATEKPAAQNSSRTAPAAQPSGDVRRVTEPMNKRFYAIAKSAGKSDEEIRDYQSLVLNLEKGQRIASADYEKAVKWAETPLERSQDVEEVPF